MAVVEGERSIDSESALVGASSPRRPTGCAASAETHLQHRATQCVMSWHSGDFNPHGGRNAFRNSDDNDTDAAGRAASLRAMRSFTESVESDLPPAPELPPQLDIDVIGCLKTSDTSDTIIEVVKPGCPKSIDPSLGETQKYKMAVPGPGHSEQEQELHKSLIAHEEDDPEIEHDMSSVKRESSLSRHVDPEHEALRREFSNNIQQRRRPTTPTSKCTIDTFAFVSTSIDQPPSDGGQKIRVSIPSKRRRSDMQFVNSNESFPASSTSQSRASFSGRITPLHDYEGDILDEVYKDKAPPIPVVHRRTSVDWENFEEAKDRQQTAQLPNGKMTNDDEEEPSFSEEMREERKKLQKAAVEDTTQAELTIVLQDPPRQPSDSEDAATSDVKPEHVLQEGIVEQNVSEPPSEEHTAGYGEGHDAHEEHYEYDPNAYPGYIWNYERQEWEVDPNYQHPTEGEQSYDYSNYDYSQAATDNAQYNAGYDQPTDSQYHAGYDQPTDISTTPYDYTTAAYHEAYDQQDATFTDYNTYTTTTYTDYSQSHYKAEGYVPNELYHGDQYADQQYSQQDQAYAQDQYQQNYDQQYSGADAQQNYDQYQYPQQYHENYDQSQYDQAQYYHRSEQTAFDQSYDYSNAQEYQSGYQTENYDGAYEIPQPAGHSENNIHTTEEATTTKQADERTTHAPPPLPPPPVAPLFQSAPAEQSPFSWEAQTSAEHVPSGPPRPPPPPLTRPEPPQEVHPAAPPARPPPAARPPPPRPNIPHPAKLPETEEKDAWAKFNEITARVQQQVAETTDRIKQLEETTAAKEIKDESYLASVGGSQGYADSNLQREIQKKKNEAAEAKLLKKKLKAQGKKVASPTYDPADEDSMDKAAQQLAAQLAAKMQLEENFQNWSPQVKQHEAVKREDSLSAIPPRKRSSLKESQQDSGGSLELPAHLSSQQRDSIAPKGDLAPDDPQLNAPAWADFDASEAVLPPSESGFFKQTEAAPTTDPFATAGGSDPFAPNGKSLIEEDYDPFAVESVEDIMAAARAKAEEARQAAEALEDVDFFGAGRQSPDISTPTPEGGSPASTRPHGFEDDFHCEAVDGETPTPLYDEDDSQPLGDFLPKYTGDGWQLMIRHPIKKKSFMAERCWKPCFVRLQDHTLLVYNAKNDNKPIQELLLQATYSLSDTTLQAYDIYGKIHTVKLQYVQYKEKVGIRPGQISRLVEGHVTKYGLPLEHSAQCNVLLKFGSLDANELQSFVSVVEDVLFHCSIRRETKPIYKQDEVQVHCYDEYSCYVDKDGIVSDQKARVRLFCLAFVTGSPFLEIGLNDRRRQGKEIVRRKDILPMYTERWIRFENLEFHSTVDKQSFDNEQVIRFSPPDGCFFEIMRFRVRPPRNREKPLTTKAIMKIAGSKVEIRIEAMAAAQIEKSKGGANTRRQIPCEDISIRFPIPEAWIYIFREERHWGVGSVHSKKLRPGKVKNLKDRLLGAVQSSEANLIEVAIGEAKYEHVYRSLVWRIPRLPEKHHAAYKAHLLRCRFELSSFDLMPETFLPRCDVEFTMPLATVSNTVVRSVSVEQHEDSDRVEKFVRYVAKCNNKVEIDYVQCADLEVDTMDPELNPEQMMNTIPELHKPVFQPEDVEQLHEGYRIDIPEGETVRKKEDSSSDDDDDEKGTKMPIIQIDMKNYGY